MKCFVVLVLGKIKHFSDLPSKYILTNSKTFNHLSPALLGLRKPANPQPESTCRALYDQGTTLQGTTIVYYKMLFNWT